MDVLDAGLVEQAVDRRVHLFRGVRPLAREQPAVRPVGLEHQRRVAQAGREAGVCRVRPAAGLVDEHGARQRQVDRVAKRVVGEEQPALRAGHEAVQADAARRRVAGNLGVRRVR
jgi:hypothetical protein